MPAGGAVGRAEGAWGDELELLAAIVESIDGLARLQYQAASGKRAPWAPLHVPRPGERSSTPAAATPQRMRALLEQARAR